MDSTFHTIYTSGTKAQKEKLKLVSLGPIKKWPSRKVSQRSGYDWTKRGSMCSVCAVFGGEWDGERMGEA